MGFWHGIVLAGLGLVQSLSFFLDKVSILTKKETKQQQRARPNKIRLRRQSLKA
jgi:hypothetical protein